MVIESQKENDNSPETKLQVTEHCNRREFKIAVMKKQATKKSKKGSSVSSRIRLTEGTLYQRD